MWAVRVLSYKWLFASLQSGKVGQQFLASIAVFVLKYARFGAAGVLITLLFASIFVDA